MLRVIVRQARPGMVLARSITNPRQSDQPLLSPGHVLDVPAIAQLHETGVYDLWVEYPGIDFLDKAGPSDMTASQQRLSEALKNAFIEQTQRSGTTISQGRGRATVEELMHAAMDSARTLPPMTGLAAVDDGLLRHSADVCALGLMLGMRLASYIASQRKLVSEKEAREMVNLGLGCLLHDVGELQMKPDCKESHHPLAFDEDARPEWKGHVDQGFSAVRGQLEPSAATVVLNHHQHFDGSGFPGTAGAGRQSGSQIHVFSRIAAAVDIFDHLLHRDGIAQPTVSALWEMQQEPMRKWFDPVVLSALLEVVPPFVPGMLVMLSDRRQAVVTRAHQDYPCYPEVQVLSEWDLMGPGDVSSRREIIDLAVTPEFYIAEVDGFDVGRQLFGPRKAEGVRYALPHTENVAGLVGV